VHQRQIGDALVSASSLLLLILSFWLPAMRGGKSLTKAGEMAIGVLVVDDSVSFLDASCALLRREGLEVVGVASTSTEAAGKVEALRPDVVLVDVNLAEESGFDLARRLARTDHGRDSTVILMSTQDAADLADLIAASPAAGFLAKSDLSAEAIRRIRNGGIR
jgi:DNA-binding NarL/FixJ family response regulator